MVDLQSAGETRLKTMAPDMSEFYSIISHVFHVCPFQNIYLIYQLLITLFLLLENKKSINSTHASFFISPMGRDESSANLGNDHEFIIKEYSLRWFEAFREVQNKVI